MNSYKLVCLMVVVAMVGSSHALPNPSTIPSQPGLQIEITALGLEKISEHLNTHGFIDPHLPPKDCPMLKGVKGLFDTEEELSGELDVDRRPKFKLTSLANDRPVDSYDGYEKIESRHKRSYTNVKKLIWQDEDFTAEEKIGGFELEIKDFTLAFNASSSQHSYAIRHKDAYLKIQVFIGNKNGHFKVLKVVVDCESDFDAFKDGVSIITSAEKADEAKSKLATITIHHLTKLFKTHIEDHPMVFGSGGLNNLIFDYRLTDHPSFKDGGVSVGIVARFYHDSENKFTKMTHDELEAILSIGKIYVQSHPKRTFKGETYTEAFDVFKSDTAPNTTALKTEGSDEAEAKRKASACVKLTLADDFFNTLFKALVASDLASFTISRPLAVEAINLYNSYIGADEQVDPESLPADFSLEVQLNDVEGDKWVTTHNGGKFEERYSFGLTYNGKHANYLVGSEIVELFRNGKIAYDVLHVFYNKEADVGFPNYITKPMVQDFLNRYFQKAIEYLDNENILKHFTEFTVEEGHFTLGLGCDY